MDFFKYCGALVERLPQKNFFFGKENNYLYTSIARKKKAMTKKISQRFRNPTWQIISLTLNWSISRNKTSPYFYSHSISSYCLICCCLTKKKILHAFLYLLFVSVWNSYALNYLSITNRKNCFFKTFLTMLTTAYRNKYTLYKRKSILHVWPSFDCSL